MARSVQTLLLILCVYINGFPLIADANIARLFTANPPDFVKTDDLKISLQSVIDKIGDRLRCEDHGIVSSECVKCLDADNFTTLMEMDPMAKSISRQNAEELGILITHQILYFESMCVSKSPGCSDYLDCQDEVLEVMGTYSSPRESLVKILRIFKMYLKENNEKLCLSADQILSELPQSVSGKNVVQDTRKMFAVIIGYMMEGVCIDAGESVTDFIDDIFHHYGEFCSPYMSIEGLKRIVHDLQSGQGNDHDHNHHHVHHHDNEHEHKHECEHTHGEYSHYHSHSDHSHGDHHHDDHNHNHLENHDHHSHYDHPHDHDENPHDAQNSTENERHSEQNPGTNLTTLTVVVLTETTPIEMNPETSSMLNSILTSTEKTVNDGLLEGARRSALVKRSPEEDHLTFNQPARSLRSDFSLPEDRHHIEVTPHRHEDDVKKVYLYTDEDNNRNVELSGTPHQFASLAAKCLSVEDLMEKFGYQSNVSLTKGDFIDLCPALIQQIVSGACTNPALPPPIAPSKMEVYGYGSIAVLVISLSSLIGVLLLPFMEKQVYSYIISGFCGLAFSTLTADALLHLIPQFLGLHTHGPGNDHGHSHDDIVIEPYAQLQLGVFATIYALFLFESIMSAFSGSDHNSSESKGHGHSHSHLPDGLPTLMSVKTKSETQLAVSRDQSISSLNTEIVEMDPIKKPPNLMVNKPIFLGLTSFAIVVTLGDSIHNFGDGLAIGAAFSTGLRGGLSTAIAVLFHELPHEFGDFVVLLSTGLSFSKALWINFLSSLTCFAGLYIGILIGDNEVARKWVMAVTAGTFLYVALGEMLPDLREHSGGSRIKMLIVKNLGILAGITLMFLISIYESKIV